MPNPKKRTSASRRDKRRTHYTTSLPTLSKCKTTGTIHMRHRAYEVDGNLYYNGKLVIEAKAD
ncbi:MAG: 50S ribosomal protein L32 [Chitinophagales bacterium]|jgi:large subunit ribosomal protein L32|nr:50S ribosomal protein L32 [Chitinophagales bacterium]